MDSEKRAEWRACGVSLADFVYHTPTRRFLFQPTGGAWKKSGVDAALPPVDNMLASTWLMRERSVWLLPKR